MNSIHDMGGMHGFGPIPREENEPVFHHPWEGRVYAINMGIPGSTRYDKERMDPVRYLASSYYERWLYTRTQWMIDTGLVTQEEYDARATYFRVNPNVLPPRRNNPELVKHARSEIFAPETHRREIDIRPAFHIDDVVKARNMHPIGHTRLPRYVRGRQGVVTDYYGIQDFEDTLPPGVDAQPQPLYAVRFTAQELWGESAEPNCAVYLNMWESYLEHGQ